MRFESEKLSGSEDTSGAEKPPGAERPQRVKRSVAVLIRSDRQVLTLRRPDDDDELPGVWGLPAGSYRGGETQSELVRRIGDEKLGVTLEGGQILASGRQDRASYVLEMDLVEARMMQTPSRGEWKWDDPEVLKPGRHAGSLCCDLALGLPV